MKRLGLFLALLTGALILSGCGQKADETKTPEQIKQEVATMDTAKIQSMIEAYKSAIADKTQALEKEAAKLKSIPLTEMLGDEAKQIKGNMEELTKSLDKLKKNMEAYAAGLKQK